MKRIPCHNNLAISFFNYSNKGKKSFKYVGKENNLPYKEAAVRLALFKMSHYI